GFRRKQWRDICSKGLSCGESKSPRVLALEAVEPARFESVSTKHRVSMAHGRILVVDDEASARNALAEILRDEGYEVETAADGFKALPKLKDFGPEVVLSDLMMPGMDGVDFLKKVKEFDAEVGVVLMTAFG